MLQLSKEMYKKYKNTDVKRFYKDHLQGKYITNPTLGRILFTQKGLGETIHRVKRQLHPFICMLQQLIETGSCDGQLEALYKPRKDRITGFYHIKNEFKLAHIIFHVDILIAQDQDGNKYYMFKKDPQGNLGEAKTSQRGPSGSTNIMNDLRGFVNGQKLYIGDCIIITIEINKTYNIHENILQIVGYHGTNNNFDKFTLDNFGTNDFGYLGKGIYLTNDMDMAQSYADGEEGRLLKVKAVINNPYIITDWKYSYHPEKLRQQLDCRNAKQINNKLLEQGYDSVMLKYTDDYGEEFMELCVFNPDNVEIIEETAINEMLYNLQNIMEQALEEDFKSWFKGSKVVDDNGDPLIVYHGTSAEFDTFDNSVNQDKTRQMGADLGYFFTDNETVARRFIPKRQTNKPQLNLDGTNFKNEQEFEEFKIDFENAMKSNDWKPIKDKYSNFFDLRGDYMEIQSKLNVKEDPQAYGLKQCYLQMRNPRYIDGDIIGTGVDREYFLQSSKENGYDGVIIKDADTGAGFANEYVVFKPNQIKSIDAKSFSNSDNIYEEYNWNKDMSNIKESLEKIDNFYLTQNAYDVIRFIKGRKQDTRIVYDSNINYYFFSLALDYTHLELLEQARKTGLYTIKNMTDYFIENEDSVYFLYYYPTVAEVTTSKGFVSEQYPNEYNYDFGTICSYYATNFEEMELYNLLKKDLNEQLAYHGSNAEFDKFDLNKFQRGDYGYGIYLTWNKDYASDYGNVKQYDIPESNELLHWEDPITWQDKSIQEKIAKLIDDIYEMDEDKYDELFENTWNYCNQRGVSCPGSVFYYKLSQLLNLSGKDLAQYLYKYGIKGTESDKGNCYCIFNPQDIKSVIVENEFKILNEQLEAFLEEAAMMKAPQETFEEFYKFCIANPKLDQKYYYVCFNGNIRIPGDTINHAWKKHKTTCEQWLDALSSLTNIVNAQKSKKKIQQRDVYLCRILAHKDYGIVFMDCPKYFYIQTLFIDNINTIDSWIYVESGGQQTGKPSASLGDNSNIRRVRPHDSNNIINYLIQKIKP